MFLSRSFTMRWCSGLTGYAAYGEDGSRGESGEERVEEKKCGGEGK